MTGPSRKFPHLAAAAAVITLAASCGHHGAGGSAGADATVGLAELFPASSASLLKAQPLTLLPDDTLAVLVAPSLEHVHERLGLAHARAHGPVREALARMLVDALGHDLLDLAHVRDTGVATGAPVAVAMLDASALALVLPLRDAAAFAQTWTEKEGRTIVMYPDHAVVGVLLDDAGYELSGWLGGITPDISLAAERELRQAAAALTFAPDAAIYVSLARAHEAVAERFVARRDALQIEELRDRVELARHLDDGDVVTAGAVDELLADAVDELLAAAARLARIVGEERLWRSFVRPAGGVAAGIGLRDGTIRVQGAIALRGAARGLGAMAALPQDTPAADMGALWLSVRVPPGLVAPLVSWLVGSASAAPARVVIEQLGGVAALDGRVSVSASELAGASRRGATVRLGLRDPARARAALGRRRGSQAGAAGVAARLDGADLVLDARAVRRREDARAMVPDRALALAPGAGMRFVLDARSLAALLLAHEPALPASAEGEVFADPGSATEEQRAEHARLGAERARLARKRDQRAHGVRAELLSQLGTIAGVARKEGSVILVHTALMVAAEDVDAVVRQGLRLWHERSAFSTPGSRIAALDRRIEELQDEMGLVRVPISPDDGAMDALFRGSSGGVLGALSGGGALGNLSGSGGVLGSLSGGNVLAPLPPGEPGSGADGAASSPVPGPAERVRVTSSVTRADPAVDRAALTAALAGMVPRLRAIYRAHRARSGDAHGYLIVDLRLDRGAAEVVSIEAAASAVGLSGEALAEGIRRAVRDVRLADTQSGTARVTLWLGAE